MEYTLLRHLLHASSLLLLLFLLPYHFLPRRCRLTSFSRFLISFLFSLLFSLPLLFLFFPWPSFLHAIQSERHNFLYRHISNETTIWKMHVVTSIPSASLPSNGSISVTLRIPNSDHDSLAVCFYTVEETNDNFDVTKAIESGLTMSVCPVSDARIQRFSDFAESNAEKKGKKTKASRGVIESDTEIAFSKVIHAKSFRGHGLAIAIQNRNWGDAQVSYRVTLSMYSQTQRNAQIYFSSNLAKLTHLWSHDLSLFVTPSISSYIVSDICTRNRNSLPKSSWAPFSYGFYHISFGPFVDPLLHTVTSLYLEGHGVILILLLLTVGLSLCFFHSPYKYSISAWNFSLWRIVTSTFAHADLIHLISNMMAYLTIAQHLHMRFCCNNLTFLTCYAVSAVTCAWLSVTLWPNAESVGASGAIYGMKAALFAMQTSNDVDNLKGFIAYIAFDTLWAMLSSRNINAMGHLGGAIGGYIFGMVHFSLHREC